VIRFSLSIPSSVVASKATKTAKRALDIARQRIVPLVVERASAAADKKAPDFAPRYRAAVRSSRAVEVTDKAVTITINDPVVKAVEYGAKAFDMKPKLLARATKTSKSGSAYVDVKISHDKYSIPYETRMPMLHAGIRAGSTAKVRSTTKTEGKMFTRQLHRGAIGNALGLSPKKQKVKHKRGFHDDLIRSSRSVRGKPVVSYSTFRRLSARSPASAWWHPGFKPRRVLESVLPDARREIAGIIRDSLSMVRSGG